jgi:hypothetical protein
MDSLLSRPETLVVGTWITTFQVPESTRVMVPLTGDSLIRMVAWDKSSELLETGTVAVIVPSEALG